MRSFLILSFSITDVTGERQQEVTAKNDRLRILYIVLSYDSCNADILIQQIIHR